MRQMRCVGLTGPVTVMGSDAAIRLQAGWQGDVHQVIGRTEKGQPVTLADGLGPHLVHFQDVVTESPKVDERPTRTSRRGREFPTVPDRSAGPVDLPSEE